MNRAVFAAVLLAVGVQAGALQLRFEMRLVAPARAADVMAVRDRDTGQQVLLSNDGVLFYDRDIGAVRAARDRSGSRVDVSLSASVSEMLHSFTTKHVGQTLGIVAEGELIFSATIAEPLRGSLSLSGLTPERAQTIASLIGSGGNSSKWPVPRTVVFGTESDETDTQTRLIPYIVVPASKGGQDSAEAAAVVAKAMEDGGYRMVSIERVKKEDLAKIGLIDVAVSDLHNERMSIEINVRRLRDPIENHDALLLWRGVFSLDTKFYAAFPQQVLARAISHYPLAGARKTEDW